MSAWRVVGKHAVNGVEPGGIIEDVPREQVETLLFGGHIAEVTDGPAAEHEAPAEAADNSQEGE